MQNDCRTTPPIGGQLSLHFHQWEATTSDTWVLTTVRSGLVLEFLSAPPKFFPRCPVSRDAAKWHLMEAAIQHLLEIQTIEPVPQEHQGQGFYSILFVIQKNSRGFRAILDLKHLNQCLEFKQFKIQFVKSILDSTCEGDFLTSIDLTEAFHVPIKPAHRHSFNLPIQTDVISTEPCCSASHLHRGPSLVGCSGSPSALGPNQSPMLSG